MNVKIIRIEELKRFSVRALESAGVSQQDAAVIADALVSADLFGVMSHGTNNLLNYILKMQAGGLNPKAVPAVIAEGLSWAMVDGNAAMGMVTSTMAMNIAIEKARMTGIAYVGVKNSCHFGTAGYYANLAARAGMLGISMSNADPVIAVPNGSSKSIGTNPFSFAVPLRGGRSLFLDIALSNVAALKVVTAKNRGEQVPESWLVDEEGLPTRDPSGFPTRSSLQPMAAHKGYGLAVLVEILAAVLTGSAILSQVQSWNLDMKTPNNVGHAFIAIDIAQMLPMENFAARMEQLANELHGAKKAKGANQIFLPGEMDWNKYEEATASGVLQLPEAMAGNLSRLAEMFNLPLNWEDKK